VQLVEVVGVIMGLPVLLGGQVVVVVLLGVEVPLMLVVVEPVAKEIWAALVCWLLICMLLAEVGAQGPLDQQQLPLLVVMGV
jgi:hypothetical protein